MHIAQRDSFHLMSILKTSIHRWHVELGYGSNICFITKCRGRIIYISRKTNSELTEEESDPSTQLEACLSVVQTVVVYIVSRTRHLVIVNNLRPGIIQVKRLNSIGNGFKLWHWN